MLGFEVVFTTITVTVLACMFSIIIAIIAGHYSGRNPDSGMLEAILVSLVVIPLVGVIVTLPMYNLVTQYDWPNNPYVLPPPFAIWAAAALGGFLGFRSGMIWNRGEASCVYCLLSVVFVLAGLSLVVVLFL
jgi:ABC-type glycerol-3-phosphate transport system permease component